MTKSSLSGKGLRRISARRKVDLRWLLGVLAVVMLMVGGTFIAHRVGRQKNVQNLLTMAMASLNEGHRESAIRQWRLLLAIDPDHEQATRELGIALVDSTSVREQWEARDLLSAVERRNPDDHVAQTALLTLLLRQHAYVEALIVARRLEKAPGDDSARWRLISEAYKTNKMPFDSLAAAIKAVEADPKDLASQATYLPLLYHSKHDEKDLRAQIDKMIAASSDPSFAHLLAFGILQECRLSGGQEHIAEALRLSPESVDALLLAASATFHEQPNKSGEYLRRALSIAPDDERVLLSYGRWLAWFDHLGEAWKILDKGFQLGGQYKLDFAWRAAECAIETHRFDETSPYLVALLNAPAMKPAYLFVRAQASLMQDQLDEAGKYCLEAERQLTDPAVKQAIAPDYQEISYKIDLCRSGLAYRRGSLADAVHFAQQAQQTIPESATPALTLGQLYFEMGDYDKSAEAWRTLLNRPFPRPEWVLGLARSLLFIQSEKLPSERNLTDINDLIEQAKRSIPNHASIPLLESQALSLAGQMDEAVLTLQAARQLRPDDIAITLALVQLLSNQGKPALAESLLATYGSDDPTILSARIGLKLQQRDFAGAQSDWEKESSRDDSLSPSMRKRIEGQIAGLAGDWDRASTAYAESTRLDPQDELAWAYQWMFLFESLHPSVDAEIDHYRRTHGEATPGWRWADSIRAVDRHASQPALARDVVSEHARVLRVQHPNHWQTLEVLGLDAELAGQKAEALRAYAKSIGRGPALSSATHRAVKLLVEMDRGADAEGVLSMMRDRRWPMPEDRVLDVTVQLARKQESVDGGSVNRLLKEVQGLPREWVAVAELGKRTGQEDWSEKLLRVLASKHPEFVQAWMALATISAEPSQSVSQSLLSEIDQSGLANRELVKAQLVMALGDEKQADAGFIRASESPKLSETDWRTLIEYFRWRKSDSLKSVLDRARRAYPDSSWLAGSAHH